MQLFVGATLGVVLYYLATWVFNFCEKEYLANAFIFVKSKCGKKIKVFEDPDRKQVMDVSKIKSGIG